MERSQISIAIILGVAVVLIISITLFISKTAEVKRTMQETAKSETTASEVKPIIRHLTSCLESTSETALTLLGKQGGYISQSQGGAFPDYTSQQAGVFFVPFLGQKVNYGISQQAVVLPDYPSLFFPYGPGPEARASSGIATLPPLNGSSFSFSYQLEHFVEETIDSCIDYAFFSQQGYSFQQGEKSAHAYLGQEEADITLYYALTIINNITREQLSVDTFSATLDARLLGMHGALASILNNDVNDLTFNLSAATVPDGMSLSVLPDAYNMDDIILLKDSRSTISGKPYEIYIARHNRNPALRHLAPNPAFSYLIPGALNFSPNTNITPALLSLYLGNISADDPDEDGVLYRFVVENRAGNPPLPQLLNTPEMKVNVIASDGRLEDYQAITIVRNP